MHHQVYLNNSNEFFQYNKSALRMDMNGRNSCTGNLRHIDIRYFLIKDQVGKGGFSEMYCPTYLMLVDYFRKTMQSALFHNFREIIMRIVSPYTILEEIFHIQSMSVLGNIYY